MDYIKSQSWSHHASCTCPIGADKDPMAVLDSNFRVRGVDGLRVVDASVFPRIPGYFVAAPIYIISEKAAEAILAGN
jgi:choline dehydrogenase